MGERKEKPLDYDDEDRPRARRTDPDNSWEGADFDSSRLFWMIEQALRNHFMERGATTNEIAEYLDVQHNSISPRPCKMKDVAVRHLLGYSKKGRAIYESRYGPPTGTVRDTREITGKPRTIWWHVDFYSPKEKELPI